MNALIVKIIYTSFASAFAFFTAPREDTYGLFRILAVWVLTGVIAFIVSDKLIGLILMGFVLAVLARSASEHRVYLFAGVCASIPIYYGALIPFPGINYLIEIDYFKVATIVLLGPVFIAKIARPTPPALKSVDRLLLIFVLLTGIMSIRGLPFTSMMRTIVDQFLLVYIPYIAISRTIVRQEQVENFVKALMTGFIVMAVIGVVSTVVRWNYYADLANSINFKVYIETRNGFLRIYSTVNTTLLGLLMGVAAVCAQYLRAAKRYPAHIYYGLLLMFGMVAFLTGSRGGFLSAILIAVAYHVLLRFNKMGRSIFVFGLFSSVTVLLVLIFQDSSLLNDEYGTLSYRAELLRVSFQQIADAPLFGAAGFIETPRFAALRQGEGIVDLVNAYLHLTLYYGLTGLALYLAANFLAIKGGLKFIGTLPAYKDADENTARLRRSACMLVAFLIGFLAMIATVSAVSYTWHFGYVLLAILTAQVRIAAVNKTTKAAVNTPPPEEGAVSVAGESKPLPYGARFVRRP